MIKTFQKKVIITAMTAITILLAVFIGAINIANYIALDNQSDRILERVTRDEGMFLCAEDIRGRKEISLFRLSARIWQWLRGTLQ